MKPSMNVLCEREYVIECTNCNFREYLLKEEYLSVLHSKEIMEEAIKQHETQEVKCNTGKLFFNIIEIK